MSLVIPAGFAELTFVFEISGSPEPKTFAFGVNDVTTAEELAAACEAWADAWLLEDSLQGATSLDYLLVKVEGRTDPGGSNLVFEHPVNQAGAGGADVLPPNCAALVKKVTAQGGRRKRGRMFIPGIFNSDAIMDNGDIEIAARSAFQDAVNVFWLAGNGSGSAMVLLHSDEVRDPSLPPPAMMPNPDPTPTPITALLVDATLATQRRRLR